LSGGLLRKAEDLPVHSHQRTTHHLVLQTHIERIIGIVAGNLISFLYFPGSEGTVLLGGIRQQIYIRTGSRSHSSQSECRDFLSGDADTELDNIVHVIGPHNGLHRHLCPVRAHHNGALGTFEQGVVRKRNAIFSDKKAVSSIQYLIVLVVGHHRKNGTFGFVYPLRGLCHTPLSQ